MFTTRKLDRRSSMAALLVTIAAGLANAQSSAPPQAREQLYTILIFEKPEALARRTNPASSDAYWSSYDAFASVLMNAGALRGGSALHETESRTVRGTGSADQGVQRARLGGYFVIAATTRAQADSLARLAPPEAVTVEVRPHRDNPHMGAMSK